MSGFNIAALERRIAALEANRGASLRFGTVTEVDAASNAARVVLGDGGHMVTMPLRVLSRRSTRDQEQCLPDIGDPAAVLFAGQGLEQGVVLGTFHSKALPAANQAAGVDYHAYEDGTTLSYDRTAHKLTAIVKGDVDIDVEGSVSVKASKEILAESQAAITLKAPSIILAGLLTVTDVEGQPGSGILSGNYLICQGGLQTPDGDVTAGNVSLRKHTHGGVENGPGDTLMPDAGPEDMGNNTVADEAAFETLYENPPEGATDKDTLLLCLPAIAQAEAESCWLDKDRQGWLNLRAMFHKWFSGPPLKDAEYGHNVFWIDIEWVLSYARVRSVYRNLIMDDILFSQNAQNTLSRILQRDEFLIDTATTFDYTDPDPGLRPWVDWKKGYFQSLSIPGEYIVPVDGISACLGNFNLRALAAGTVDPLENGGHRITVTRVSVLLWDSFNFNKEDELGYWSCTEKSFSLSSISKPSSYLQVYNSHFQQFRAKHGKGMDFMVLSRPKNIDYLPRYTYDTEL